MFRRQSKNFKEPTGPSVIISTGAGVSIKEKLKMLNKRESLRSKKNSKQSKSSPLR